nr:hypothetical protein [uncultured Flavobacterium sp.]
MKPLSQHIQETLFDESLKEAFNEKLVDEELDALTRIAPAENVPKADTSSFVDKTISGK